MECGGRVGEELGTVPGTSTSKLHKRGSNERVPRHFAESQFADRQIADKRNADIDPKLGQTKSKIK